MIDDQGLTPKVTARRAMPKAPITPWAKLVAEATQAESVRKPGQLSG